MTALSKATLKNIWKARFQPQASDFGNLIDSWTDYDATLTAIAVAASAGTTGVPLVTAPGAVTFVSASAAAIAGIPIFSGDQTSSLAVASANTQSFLASTSALSRGFYMQAVGGTLPDQTINDFHMRTYKGNLIGTALNNRIFFEAFHGLPSSPTPVSGGARIGTVFFTAYGDTSSLYGAAIAGQSTATASAAAAIDINFYSDLQSGAVLNLNTSARQFRIRQGCVNFVPKAAAPASPSAGDVYYDSPTNKLKCWNGTSWNDLF